MTPEYHMSLDPRSLIVSAVLDEVYMYLAEITSVTKNRDKRKIKEKKLLRLLGDGVDKGDMWEDGNRRKETMSIQPTFLSGSKEVS